MAAKPAPAKAKKQSRPSKAFAASMTRIMTGKAAAEHTGCTGASCAYCLQKRDSTRIQVGDEVRERKPMVGKQPRHGIVQRVEPRKGKLWLLVKFGTATEEQTREDFAEEFHRTGAVKVINPKLRIPRDLSVYQVFRCIHGITYLRVEMTKYGAKFVVNKGFSVDLVEMDGGTCRELGFTAIVGSSVWEAARRLLRPLNDQVTISVRAKIHLDSILQNKELENMATANAKATKTAKFATVTAPAAKGSKAKKAAKGPKDAKIKAAKSSANGAGGGGRLDKKTVHITSKIKNENPLREGTFCHAQVEAVRKADGKTVEVAQQKLDASGSNPNKRRIEIAWLVKNGFITVKEA